MTVNSNDKLLIIGGNTVIVKKMQKLPIESPAKPIKVDEQVAMTPAQPAVKAAGKHAGKHAEKPAERPAEKPAEKPAEQPPETTSVVQPSKLIYSTCKNTGRKERIIMLGWRPDVREMILEYDAYVGPGSELVVLAEAPLEQREHVTQFDFTQGLKNIHVTHKVGNPMSRFDLKTALLEFSEQCRSDDDSSPLSVVVLADQRWWLGDTSLSDKQSAYVLLLAESLCKQYNISVSTLVAEFIDKRLGKQIIKTHPSLTYVCTNEIMALVTSQVMADRDMNLVWTELLNSWGNEIYMKDISFYAAPGEQVSFDQLSERAALNEEVAIGYKQGDNLVINPKSKGDPLLFDEGDTLIVIAETEYGQQGRSDSNVYPEV